MLQTTLPAVPEALRARGVRLRPCRDEDAEFLREVYVAYRWEEMQASGWPEAARRAFLHDQHRLQDAHYRQHYQGAARGVIEVAGQPAGRLYLYHCGHELRIVDVAFLPDFRGQGLGGAMITAVQQQAAALGIPRVSIHVERNNPALRLYQRLGFGLVEERSLYWLLEWRPAGLR
jgi:ribosomal protein S18 acetylase RimI-like enzyme